MSNYNFNWENQVSNSLPLCPTSRHQRYRFAEAFGPLKDVLHPLRDTDILVQTNRKYRLHITITNDDDFIRWKVEKNESY